MHSNLFTYGVLSHPKLFEALTGKRPETVDAELRDFERYTVQKPGYPRFPAAVATEGASIQGTLIRQVDAESMRILDEFEEVDEGLFERTQRVVFGPDGQALDAFVYLPGKEVLAYLSGSWNLESFLDAHYEEYLRDIIPDFLRGRE